MSRVAEALAEGVDHSSGIDDHPVAGSLEADVGTHEVELRCFVRSQGQAQGLEGALRRQADGAHGTHVGEIHHGVEKVGGIEHAPALREISLADEKSVLEHGTVEEGAGGGLGP